MKTSALILGLFLVLNSKAQTFDLSSAIQTALSNNLEIKIAENNAAIAHNNNNSGNAGMLPNVSLNAGATPAMTNINQKFTNGTTIEKNNVLSNAVNANVIASYTLFDGMRMFAVKERLELLDDAAKIRLKSQIQNTISNVIIAYCNILKNTTYLDVLNQLKQSSQERLTLIEQRMKVGYANKSDLYMAQLDLQSREQAIETQKSLISNAHSAFKLLLNLKPESLITLNNLSVTSRSFNKSELDSMVKNNPDWQLAQNTLSVSQQVHREANSATMPVIRLSGAYNYNFSQSQAGFSLFNQSMGPQLGLTLSMPLYTGSVNKSNIENAKLNVKNAELMQQFTQQQIQTELNQAWTDYSTIKVQVESDSTAVLTANNYLTLMKQKFDQNQSTLLEIREAMDMYNEIHFRYINNQFLLKMAETRLLTLSGQL